MYDPEHHQRRSVRLAGYDYAEARAYFVTICTQGHVCLFGEIVDGQMRMNALGQIVQKAWHDLPNHYGRVELDAFVVMPNHIHGIIMLTPVGAGFKPAFPGTGKARNAPNRHGLGEIVRAFKTFSCRQVNKFPRMQGASLWQRSYYDHIIRNERALNHIRRYVIENPLRWTHDRENPAATGPDAPDTRQA